MNQYLKNNQQLEEIKKTLSDKQNEHLPLTNAINATNLQIAEIEKKLENSPKKLADGDMSIEDILSLKRELVALKESLREFNEARAIQKASLQPLNKEQNCLINSNSALVKEAIGKLPEKLTRDLVEQNREDFENLLKAYVSTQEQSKVVLGRFGKGSIDDFYTDFGKLICAAFGNLPSLAVSKQAANDMAVNFLTTEEV